MAAFTKGGGNRTPFGSNEYLRSTKDVKTESYTFAASTGIPTETIDGVSQKVLKPGEIIAKITSGGDSGKVGVFMAGVTDGRQTLANIVGINDTWLPWQLMEHDNEIAVAYECAAVQAWCIERDAGGLRIALTNTTAAAMVAQKSLSVIFK